MHYSYTTEINHSDDSYIFYKIYTYILCTTKWRSHVKIELIHFIFCSLKFKSSGVGRMSEQLSRRITTIVTLKKFRLIEYDKSTTEEQFLFCMWRNEQVFVLFER